MLIYVLKSNTVFSIQSSGEEKLLSEWKNNQLNDTTRLNALFVLVEQMNDPVLATSRLNEGIEMSKKGHWKFHEMKAHSLKAYQFHVQNRTKKAIEEYKIALNLALSIHNNTWAALTFSDLGIVSFQTKKYRIAENYFNEGLNYANKSNNTRVIINLNFNLGILYSQIKNFDKAISTFNTVLEYTSKANDEITMMRAYQNLALIYYKDKNYNRARKKLALAKIIAKKLDEKRSLAMITENYGGIYLAEKNYKMAIKFYQNAVTNYEEISDLYSTIGALRNLADAYNQSKNYTNAILNLNKAIQYSISIENKNQRLLCLEMLANVYSAKGDNKNQELFSEKYQNLKDSIQQDQVKLKMNEDFREKKLQLKKAEMLKKKLEYEKRKHERLAPKNNTKLIATLFLGLTGILLIVYFIRRKNQKKH